MSPLILLAAAALAGDPAIEKAIIRDEVMKSQPFIVKWPRGWEANPEGMDALLLRGERSREPLDPFIVVQVLGEKADDYIEKMTAPKTRTEHRIPVKTLALKAGPAKTFMKTSTERYPKGEPDARVVQILHEHVVIKTAKLDFLLVLVAPEGDFKTHQRDFDRVLESFRVNDKITVE